MSASQVGIMAHGETKGQKDQVIIQGQGHMLKGRDTQPEPRCLSITPQFTP